MTRRLQSLKQALQIGMVYPVVVVLTAVALFGVVCATLIPSLVMLYQDMQAELPWWLATFAVGADGSPSVQSPLGFFQITVPIICILLAIVMLCGLILVPSIRGIRADYTYSRFSHLLSMLVEYGVPLPEALRLAGETASQSGFRNQSDALASMVESGEDIQTALAAKTKFPPFLNWLIATGHQNSELPVALGEAAEFYQTRAESRIRWVSKVFPTATITCLGGGVTFLYVMTVFGPMIDLWTQLAQR